MTIGLWEMASYAGALLILFLTPGPVWVALTARALSGGFHAAWPLALGVVVGDVLWPFLAILGVTWIVSVFAGFMTFLRWVACATFVIGGADGIDPGLRDDAAFLLSFGQMVWPHMLARVMLSEQLYRAASILAGSPYHRV